ncbi:MAG: type II secretion system F family protein [Elusimicrobia bacterium]|nr:type II secretion system F family protein [Elusimicrobiota bacterium]
MTARLLFLSALLGLAAPLRAQVFTPAEVKHLADKNDGAEARMQKFYHYFKRDRDPSLPVPAWVDQTLEAMLKRPVWQDPEEGILNEAQLWQAPASVLYEFFELTRKTFLPADGGQLANPTSLIRDYEDNRIRFQMSLDRLYRARLGSSLSGRGRSVISDFDLIIKEMDTLMDALTSGRVTCEAHDDKSCYKQAVMAIGALSRNAYDVLHAPPRGYAPPGSEKKASPVAAYVFKLLGILLMFTTGWLVGSLNEAKISDWADKYRAKAKEWAYEYERQFLTIKINYLVGGPAALGLLIGILTFDPFGFVIFSGFGIYCGLILPGWLLRNIRFRRGMKCEAQLMDAMILMSNGLKSGIDLVQCIELVQRDLQPPISEEFGLCIKNYQLGTPLERALEGVEERVQSRLLSYMIKAVVIQRTVGGNLTKIFDRIVDNIREESKLVEKTAALTAQQRIQAIVVGIMPWVMLIVMFLFQPGPMKEFYFTGLGFMVLLFCTVWIAIGMKVVNKLGDIQV